MKLLPQLKLGPRVGGAKELATRVAFYNGIANTLMVAGVYYSSNTIIPGTTYRLQELVPSVAAFYGGLAFMGFAAMAFEHIIMVKAQAEYNQLQNFDEDVSPIRQEVRELQESIDRIEDKIDDK